MSGQAPMVSVIIPAHDEAHIIGPCLEAALASDYRPLEVIVVDDCSGDGTAKRAEAFPCRVIRAAEHLGVSRARNLGAQEARGELLFFTDADCLLAPRALTHALETWRQNPGAAVGGTYARQPVDEGFFNRFQAVLVNHFETSTREPDYIAAHALLIEREVFLAAGGFSANESFGVAAGVEDVELSHRLRRSGLRLLMDPRALAAHHFGFDLRRSLANAWRKSLVWTRYSLSNRDLLADSGFASRPLKANVAALGLALLGLTAWALGAPGLWAGLGLAAFFAACLANLVYNRRVLAALAGGGSTWFALRAWLYYLLLYPLPIAAAGLTALAGHVATGLARRRGSGG